MLEVARDAQFFLEPLAGPLLFEEPGVFEYGGGFDGQGLQDLAIARRQVGQIEPRIQIQQPYRVLRAAGVGQLEIAASHADQRHADDAAQIEGGHGLIG